jgi:hypothetical protein
MTPAGFCCEARKCGRSGRRSLAGSFVAENLPIGKRKADG